MAGADDITPWVDLWRYRHGANVLSNKRGFSLIKGRGKATLENGDDYWTDERLDALTSLIVFADNVEVARCRVSEWDRIVGKDRRFAELQLESAGAGDYDKTIRLDAAAAWNETQILADTGVAVTAATAWEGYQVDQGVCWCGGLFDFVQRLAAHGNGIAFETHDGKYGVLLPQTDRRDGTVTIRPSRHNMILSSMTPRRRLGWRRSGQLVNTLEGDPLVSRSLVYDGSPPKLISAFTARARPEAQVFDVEPQFGTGERWRIFFGHPANFAAAGQTWPTGETPVFIRAQEIPDTRYLGGIINYTGPGASGGNPFRIYRRNERSQGYELYVESSGINTAYFRKENMTLAGDLILTAYFGEGTPRAYTLPEAGDPTTFLRAAPWAVHESSLSKFAAKLAWWSTASPVVTPLRFLATQPTEEAWREILGLRLGSAAAISFNVPGAALRQQGYPLFAQWTYRGNRTAFLDLHFLSLREATTLTENYLRLRGEPLLLRGERILLRAG